MKVNLNGSTTKASQASPVLPEVKANGKATTKNADPISARPNPTIRIGTSITIANDPGRSCGIAAETFNVNNAKSRQAMVIIFNGFALLMFLCPRF